MTVTAREQKAILAAVGICKSFANNRVLDNISFDVRPGEIHALVGENGAGKSTLMNILSGNLQPDSGMIRINDTDIRFQDPSHATEQGIAIVHQELSLSDNMTVAENIFCRQEPVRFGGLVRWKEMNRRAEELFARLGLSIDPHELVGSLSVAWQQMVEITKALSRDAKVIIMDEPTSALSDSEISYLFGIIRDLRRHGVAVIYISHKLNEVFELADRISVLRDGLLVKTMPVGETDNNEVVRLMVGRDITEMYPPKSSGIGETIFEVSGLRAGTMVKDVSFSLHQGEILCFAGLVGSGRTETGRAIFGADRRNAGTIRLKDKEITIRHPRQAIDNGVCYLPEDRKTSGLFLTMSVRRNIVSASLERFSSRFMFISNKAVCMESKRFLAELDIRPAQDTHTVINFSGGNQQKTLLAKWLSAKPAILIVDEPTRGVDVGAKANIHKTLRALAESGIGIIVISSELPEVLGLGDRILVFRDGTIVADMINDNLTQAEVIKHATN